MVLLADHLPEAWLSVVPCSGAAHLPGDMQNQERQPSVGAVFGGHYCLWATGKEVSATEDLEKDSGCTMRQLNSIAPQWSASVSDPGLVLCLPCHSTASSLLARVGLGNQPLCVPSLCPWGLLCVRRTKPETVSLFKCHFVL